MSKRIFQLALFFLLQLVIIFTHLVFVDFLTYPFDRLNLSLVFLILYFVITIRPQTFWLLLPFFWLGELYSSLPFGVNALALLVVSLVFDLALVTVFSNRSLPTIVLLSILLVSFYRILLWIFLKTINFFILTDTIILDWEWSKNLGWEIVFTTLITVVIYFLLSLFLKRLHPEYIIALQKEYEPKRSLRQ